MYQINIGKFKQLLQTVTNFRTSLEATNDFLGTQIAAIRECSSGEVRATFIQGMMLLRTEYYNEIQRIRCVETVLTDALNNAVMLKDRIRKLENVARGEDVYYGEGILANEAEYDGIIAFDESTVENVTRLCTHMTDFADQLETMINGVEDSVSGLVDLETEADQLRADCNKARIAGVYGTEYCKIGELFEDLNEQVKTGLLPYTPEDYKEVTADAVKASYARYAGRDSLEGLLATGTEQEKYQKTLELLKKESLSDEEEVFLCACLESYCETADQIKLEGFFEGLIVETFDETHSELQGELLWYTVSVDTEGVQGLLDKATEMECPRAYEYLMAAKQIMPNKIQAEAREECTFQTSWSKMKDNTARLSVIVKTDINGTNYWADIEALDSEKWTLTEKAKSDYYEVIDYLDDDTLLLLGKMDPGVNFGSHFQAFVLGEMDQVDQYIVANAESKFKGNGNGAIDYTIGQGESIINGIGSILNRQILEPGAYIKSVLTGECEDSGAEGVLKFGAGFVQLVTGIPAYSSINDMEEDLPVIKEACKDCGEILTGLWSIRPEEWASMAGEALSYAGNQLEQQAEYQIDRIEEFSKYTPEQWENLAINACKAAYENKEREIQELFSKENVSNAYYVGGYAETTITLFVLECLLGAKLAEVFKVGNVAKGDEVVTSLSDLMSPEDAESYLKFLQNGSTAGLTKEEIAAINKVDEALALKKIDYQDILDMRKASNLSKGGTVAKIQKIKPSLPEGSKPFGNYAKEINDQYKLQNRTADLFASKGYDVKMLDEVVGGNGYGLKPDKNPDFLIEGKVFDCYTPNKTTKVDTIIRKIQQKTNEQAPNITLNLDLYEGDMDELIDIIKRKAVPEGDLKHLEELWIIKNNEILYVFD